MKTFKSEKHNIPEGATHHGVYGCDTDCYFKKDGETYLLWKDENWSLSHFDHHRWVKPITQPTYLYENVTDSIFDLKEEFERGELYHWWLGNHEPGSNSVGYDQITDEKMLLCRYEEKRLLRRIEVTERELFIDAYASAVNNHMKNVEDVAGKLYDAGCRFVNGKG